MIRTNHAMMSWACLLLWVAVAFCAGAQSVQHLGITQPGGMPGSNVITDIELVTNGLEITWDGPSGYCQLFEKTNLDKTAWHALGKRTNLVRFQIVSDRYSNSYFRVAGPVAHYVGATACAECHKPILNIVKNTPHFGAFTNAEFVADGGQTNEECFACHTVGFGIKSGFVSKKRTPHLENVQCENCHGPAAVHAANPDDPAFRPRVEVAAEVCGGCHSGPRYPMYNEWTNSLHAGVVQDFNATNEINNCGRCHSGTVRLALLNGTALPEGDADVGIVCATCHDPHQTNSNPAQLRNPLASMKDYYMPASGAFTNYYNPNINICAQCHNHAGASWTNNAREPHHSLQYNMLLGTVGELESGQAPSMPGTHALDITNQCVDCHMQTSPYVSDAQPAVSGHSFTVTNYAACVRCHGLSQSLMAENVAFATGLVSNQIQQIKFDLDYWAANKAPPALAKYGNLAWEYTAPGSLSAGSQGPDATEQALIPVNIQKARFNLYLVNNDGSYGIHNVEYVETLLNAAEDWIYDEFDQ